jgi:hypothetical protein
MMKTQGKKHSLQTRWRAFTIWQKLGYFPWRKPLEARKKKHSGDFYRGAFDSIPFLNDDAKRTFSHLLLRPGYMIRDYINGQTSKYLSPLTALIIFYAFFGLVSALLKPYQQEPNLPIQASISLEEDENGAQNNLETVFHNFLQILNRGYVLMHLDQFPEEVDTQRESSLAALEGTLRSQGIPLFIGEFLLLWLAMMTVMRKGRLGPSACAATAAYVLCQFSFFMLFALLLSWGNSSELGFGLILLLLLVDYKQLLGVSNRKALSLTIRTGIMYAVFFGAIIVKVIVVATALAFFKV